MIGIFKTFKLGWQIGSVLAVLALLFFGVQASKKAFENKFQKPYAEEKIKPYLDSLKTEREQFKIVYNELDTVSKQLFALESDCDLMESNHAKQIEQMQSVIRQLKNQEIQDKKWIKALESEKTCFEMKGLFNNKKVLVDCETREEI